MPRLLTVLLVLLSQLSTSRGFHSVLRLRRLSLRLHADVVPWESAFPDAQVLTIQMQEHRPLGCTVEESLADSDLKPVFVSKVIEGSFASQAGLKVGDVILAISGVFGGMNNVLGRGIDEVTSTVAGRPEGEALELRIARGTQVLTQHESALVDLCASVGEDEKAIEECVVNFLTSAYSDDEGDEPGMEGSCGDDEETECLLDDMFETLWGTEFSDATTSEPKPDDAQVVAEAKPNSAKPLPWRSRASPSGTFVRDPKTGKMRNIDA